MKLGSLKIGVGGAVQIGISAIIISLLLASCGGGGNTSTGAVYTGTPPAAPVPVDGPDSFLLYPNPQISPPVDSETYSRAYYTAIDPSNTRDTLAKFMSLNGFDNLSTGSEVQAVFGDMRDLGYGRYVTARRNADGTMAVLTANYLVWSAAGYGYSSMNLDAAVAQDKRWYIGTNGIEYSPGPNGGRPFVKYYSYDTNGVRVLAANLDGRGVKAMPGICTNCHGGRGDPLTAADASGNQLFAVVGDPASGVRGDLKGKLHFFEPDTFSFSSLPGYTRAEQEAKIKTLNQWVLCSYPLPTYQADGVTSSVVPTGFAEDACRTVAPTSGEWQGGAATVVKAAYGGDGMPNATYIDNYVPASWVVAGQASLYRNVVQPACRMCHILRGTGEQSDMDFSTYESFRKQAEDIRSHVVDLGNMPSTKVLYNRYWATPGMHDELNAFLLAQTPNPASNPYAATPDTLYRVLDTASGVVRAGRPIANAGPSRTVSTGASTLDAQYSKFADTYQWSIYSSPASAVNSPATLSSTTAVQTTFNATVDGTYIVKLFVSKGAVQSDPSYIALVVNSALTPLPSAIRFADIKNVFQNISGVSGAGCGRCHFAAGKAGSKVYASYEDIDRNGDGIVASGVGGTDDIWFYNEVRGRINLSDIADSPLLRKPTGHSHGDATVRTGFGDKTASPIIIPVEELVPGDVNREYYDLFLNWILNGAPYQ